jgi:hypothetical protein
MLSRAPVRLLILGRGGRARRITGLTPPVRQVAPVAQGVGVVGSQHPQVVGEQFLVRGGRARRITGLTPLIVAGFQSGLPMSSQGTP